MPLIFADTTSKKWFLHCQYLTNLPLLFTWPPFFLRRKLFPSPFLMKRSFLDLQREFFLFVLVMYRFQITFPKHMFSQNFFSFLFESVRPSRRGKASPFFSPTLNASQTFLALVSLSETEPPPTPGSGGLR